MLLFCTMTKKSQATSYKNMDLEGCTNINSVCIDFRLVLQIDVIGLCSDLILDYDVLDNVNLECSNI
jgi:hypothetical protein